MLRWSASARRVPWSVITSAPCSGKTAVIETLAGRGYTVVPEVARAYIDSLLAEGRTLAQIKADALAFERHILLEKVRIEQALAGNRPAFLDRAVPDSIAYFRLEGLPAHEPMRLSRSTRYARIFLFERLDFEKDNVRAEDEALAARLEMLLAEAYVQLGYEVIRVPVMDIHRRAAFVLERAPAP